MRPIILLLLALVVTPLAAFAQVSHFSFTSNTGESYSLVIDNATLNGSALSSGDEIGVFTPAGLCVGASAWTGTTPLALTAWKDDSQTGTVDGYTDGEKMSFKIWDASASTEIDATPTYTQGNGNFGDGAYARLSLAATSGTPTESITVTQPNGGESWQAGSQQTIRWSSSNFSGQVRIEYSTDGGGSYTDIVASTADDGSHDWTVPATPSLNCRVRVSDAADGDPSDASDASFTISSAAGQASITVVAPNGAEVWEIGSSQQIQWTSSNTSGQVRIEYSTNYGIDYTDVVASTADNGSYTWTIPNTPSQACMVRISDAADNSINDSSDNEFTIASAGAAVITVLAPNGGENWQVGTQQEITWSSSNYSGQIGIEYSTDGAASYSSVVASTDDDGSYMWTVPNTPSTQCVIRVFDPSDNDPTDISNATFTISSAGGEASITLISPNGGENWRVGSEQTIQWSSSNFSGPIHIEYSTDGGSSYNDIAASTEDDGSYDWNVPETPSQNCRVRVSDAGDGDPSDVSDNNFTISAEVVEELIIVTTTADNGPGSLREAINLANSTEGRNIIVFQIPDMDPGFNADAGVWTILPQSPLPVITDDETVIDGLSQFEFAGGMDRMEPLIELKGSDAGEDADGLTFNADAVDVVGLTINEFDGAGIYMYEVDSGLIARCIIGLDASGQEAAGNREGVRLSYYTHNVTIGPLFDAGNVISGNHEAGIAITDTSYNNIVLGNLVGANIEVSEAIGNDGPGIYISDMSHENEVVENSVHGNDSGIYITDSNDNMLAHNWIGGHEDPELDMGNSDEGVVVTADSKNNTIIENVIVNNGNHGVKVHGEEALYNTISRNSITHNGESGIHLLSGGNMELEAPEITGVSENQVTGTAEPHSLVEVFADFEDQGAHFLGETRADESGNFICEIEPGGFWEPYITATATDEDGNTSEFSEAFEPGDIDQNLVPNGEFDRGNEDWFVEFGEEAEGDFDIDEDELLSGPNSLVIEINNGGSETWHVMAGCGVGLEAGESYELSFMAKASRSVSVEFGFDEPDEPYETFWSNSVMLQDKGQHFGPFQFRIDEERPFYMLMFWLGSHDNVTIWLDNVVVRPAEGTAVTESADLAGVPEHYALEQNFPNPFNPTTRISYHLPEAADVIVEIYDLRGCRVRTLVNAQRPAGRFRVLWDGLDDYGVRTASGMYLYRITARGQSETFSQSKKMILLK